MNNDIEKIEAIGEPDEDTVDTAEDIDEAALLDELSGKKPKKTKKSSSAGAKRRLRYRTAFIATIAVAAVAVILLNVLVGVLADRFPLNLDITASKSFTLNEQSINVAQSVDKPIELVIFTDEDTFENPDTGISELDTTLREFNNALKQYNNYSEGKITYSFLNPSQDPTKFAAYSKYDVTTGDMLFLCGERFKVRTVYDNSYDNDLYTIDTSSYSSTGEYSFESKAEQLLASTIYSLSIGEDHIVQVLTGHEEEESTIAGLKDLYERNGYTFEEHLITGSAEFNKDAETMLIAAPETDYSAEEIKRVRDWVYNNGNYGRQLMVFVSPLAKCPNLYEFLEVEYGITVTDELMLETDYNRIQGYSTIQMMADVPESNYTENAYGEATVYTPYVRRLTTTLPAELDTVGAYGIPLLEYPESVKLAKLDDLNDENVKEDEDRSYAASKDDYPLIGGILCSIDEYNNDTGKAVDGRVFVSGCSGMAYSNYLNNASLKNEEFLLDTLNTMTGVESAITISGKTLETEYVTFSSGVQSALGIGVFTIGLPVIVLAISLVVFIRRKRL